MSELLKRKVLVPSYMKDFRCIGSKCEDTCCAGWKVNVDRKTYKKYKSSSDSELKLLFKEHISRERKQASDMLYAKINMKKGVCPFLTEAKLCKLHLRSGEELLSDVCHSYPKKTFRVSEYYQQSAGLSCPEVARQVLTKKSSMNFCEIESSIRSESIVSIDIRKYYPHGKYYDELRTFTIQLLKSEDYKIWEKLILLGMFYDKAQEKVDSGKFDEIIDLIESYTELVVQGTFKDDLQYIKPQIDIQIEQTKIFIAITNSIGTSNWRFLQCFNEFKSGFGDDLNSDFTILKQKYEELIDKYYDPFMSEQEYVLENYLVNNIFGSIFPFVPGKNLFENYITLIINYLYIKTLLVGMSGFHRENFGMDCIITLIQSFSRLVDHNSLYIDKAIEIMKKSGAAKLSYIALLIRDK